MARHTHSRTGIWAPVVVIRSIVKLSTFLLSELFLQSELFLLSDEA